MVNIITRSSHYEILTMSGAGFILNDRLARGQVSCTADLPMSWMLLDLGPGPAPLRARLAPRRLNTALTRKK